jgi:hypothetical protein
MKRTFTQICELLILDMYCKNLCKKTSFRATDATTKPSDQEDNEKKDFFFFLLQNNATRKNDDKIKTKRMKRKLWLKAQIANRIRAPKSKSNQDNTDSNTCLKTMK